MKHRFDRDLQSDDYEDVGFTPPKEDDLIAIVVTDFAKGILMRTATKNLLAIYPSVPIVLRPKVRSTLELPWTVLTPNREDFSRLFRETDPLPPRVLRTHRGDLRIHPSVLRGMKELAERFPNRAVVLKLDAEGAVLLDLDGRVHAFALSEESRGPWAGVSAGDVLISDLVHAMEPKSPLSRPVRDAVASATWYCRTAERIVRDESGRHWYGRLFAQTTEISSWSMERRRWEAERIVSTVDLGLTPSCLTEHERLSGMDAGKVLALKAISLAEAEWYLPGFSTVDPALGRELQGLAQQLIAFCKVPHSPPRTMAIAVCGPPGSGRTTLSLALARAANVKLVTANVSQWHSSVDLVTWCEQIRTHQLITDKAVLAFIDEVDAPVPGSPHVYGQLLGPLMDGEYFVGSERRQLGKVAFLLAGSTRDWSSAKGLLQGAGNTAANPKLRDMVSRLSRPPIETPRIDGRLGDRLFVAVAAVLQRFPRVRLIQRRLLWLLLKSNLRYGTRSLVNAIEELPLHWDETGHVSLARTELETTGKMKILEFHLPDWDKLMPEFDALADSWTEVRGDA